MNTPEISTKEENQETLKLKYKQQSIDQKNLNGCKTNDNRFLYLKNIEKNTLDIEIRNYGYKLTGMRPNDVKLIDNKMGIWLISFDKDLGKFFF